MNLTFDAITCNKIYQIQTCMPPLAAALACMIIYLLGISSSETHIHMHTGYKYDHACKCMKCDQFQN